MRFYDAAVEGSSLGCRWKCFSTAFSPSLCALLVHFSYFFPFVGEKIEIVASHLVYGVVF